MEDERIIDLYWDRNQNAINETAVKYGIDRWSLKKDPKYISFPRMPAMLKTI